MLARPHCPLLPQLAECVFLLFLQTYLTPPRILTLEDVIGYVAGDELIEVTPKSIRLRKQVLESNLRKSGKKRAVA